MAPGSGAPLAGLRVVEFSTFVAVPSGTMTLASLGAEVIRIDPIGGASDTNRAPVDASGTSIYWASMNKCKRSVMLDLRSEEGRELAVAIATVPGPGSGFFVTNAVGDGWFGEATLRVRRDDLIWIRLLGNADGRPALDYTVNWEVGFAAATGPGGSPAPTMHVLPAWDLLAGMHVALDLLAAERRRGLTGEGASVVLSLADVALWSTDAMGILAEVQLTGHGRERTGDFVYGTFGTPFGTADGPPVIIVALTTRQWLDLVEVTGTAEAIAGLEREVGSSMTDEHVRWQHRERLRTLLAPWFASRTTADVLRALHGTRLVSSALGRFDDTANGPMVQENPLFTAVTHPLLGAIRSMGNPAVFAQSFERPAPLAPVLGQHTEAVLGETLGLTQTEIGVLIDRGVAAGGRR
jgi:2-methylfumaryl-CoA isomerase